jgi:hypothetical protein
MEASAIVTACVLCDRNLSDEPTGSAGDDTYLFACATCGRYRVDGADLALKVFNAREMRPHRYLLSALTKASPQPIALDEKLRNQLREGSIREKTIGEKIEAVVRWFATKSDQLGRAVPTDSDADYPVAACRGPTEWGTLLQHLGRPEVNLLALNGDIRKGAVAITVKGLQWLAEQPKASGAKVLIAMSFDPSLNDVKDAIAHGIRQAGYDPIRVDDDHYNGGVMDRIIGIIRESKFIVSDFTQNRGGVYYEAGVAFGLGIPIVNVCAAECLAGGSERLHFDVQHLNFISWKREDLPALTSRLKDRIVAVFGRGPRELP